jgi:predicted nucleotidyltransferase
MSLRRSKQLSERDRAIIIEELKAFLHTHEEILFAILYGSLVDSVASERYGDIDLALYMKPEQLNVLEYVLESKIEAEVYRVLSVRGLNFPPVEIHIINNAPSYFLINIFKSNYVILKGDEEVLTDFIDAIGEKSMANFYFRTESLRELAES